MRYQALFTEAGGLAAGNDGDDLGHQSRHGVGRFAATTAMRWSRSPSTGTVRLGSDTTAHIRTGTLLGERVLTLESAGGRHDATGRR